MAAIDGPAERTVTENYAEVLGVYTVSGTADWSLSGVDAEAFDLTSASSQASLSFSSPPNFEAPTDTDEDGKNTYHVTLEATPVFGASSDEGTLADFMAAFQKSSDEDAPTWTKAVRVRVEDGDDPGVVTLPSRTPRAGVLLRAELKEEDEVTPGTTAWTWERQRQGSDEWHFIGSSTSASASAAAPASKAAPSDFAAMFNSFNWGSGKVSHYEPTVQDTNWVLRATVQWAGHEVSSPDSAPVRAGVPDPPRRLEGEGYAAKVVLSWRTPNNNGSEITGYEYRKRLDDNAPWDPDWTPIDGSTKETTSHPVEDLAYDEMHTFEVRAVNAEGEGAAARTQATAGCPTPVIVGPNALSVKENHVAQLARYTVEDTRCGPPRWSLAGPDARHFSLFQRKLTVKRKLNYEQPQDANMDNHYQLHVVAHDKHDPSQSDQLDVQVEVTDVNEPLVLYGPGNVAIPENWTGEVTTYTAADPEGATIYWKLKGPDAERFRLAVSQESSETAWLHLDRSLNFEAPPPAASADGNNAYQLYIEASDGLHTDTIQVFVRVRLVTVRVTNVNERPWVHGPLRLSFAENDTGFVGRYHAYDPDAGDGLRWSLGEQTDPFRLAVSLNRRSAGLHVARPMDYEAIAEDAQGERAYQLDVTVRDEGLLSSSVHTKVVVLDVNEPPVLSGPSVVNMNENNPLVAAYTATDPEGTAIRWSILGLDAPLFRLSSAGSSERLYFFEAPDYESDPRSYSVTIQAADSTGLFVTQGLSITILNVVDETPPSQPPTNSEGEDAGTVTLEPIQPREGEAVTATLEDGDGSITNTAWTWEVEDGTVVSTGSDTETDSYTPSASDVGKALVVTVSYEDAEGTDPEQASATSAAVLGATEPASCLLLTLDGPASVDYPKQGTGPVASYSVRASHCDALSWSLSGSDADAFSLGGSDTAQTLSFTTSPDQSSYAVTITVEDASGGSLAKGVTITITEEDPDSGGDGDQPGSISLSSNPPKVGEILTATLTDPDGNLRDVIWGFDDVSPADQSQTAQARAASSPPPSSHSTS